MYNRGVEFAKSLNITSQPRALGENDKRQVMWLLQNGSLAHVHSDWRSLADWIGTPGFVGLEQGSDLAAFLAVGADPLPAFWVRGVALKRRGGMQEWLEELFAAVIPWMRQKGGEMVAWMPYDDWSDRVAPDLGFSLETEVVTLIKQEPTIPPFYLNSDVTIRPVEEGDFNRLAEIEAAAFDPIWRYSAQLLALAQRQAYSFDVAEIEGRIVGYQCSSQSYIGAHLARMTIHPDCQGVGVGSALLAATIQGYKRGLIREISLNTQIDNHASHRLYKKFGFHMTERAVSVWTRRLDE